MTVHSKTPQMNDRHALPANTGYVTMSPGRRFAHSAARVILVAFALLLTVLPPLQAEAANSRSLTLIRPDAAAFNAILSSSFPGLQEMSGFESIRSYMFILRNDTPYKIVAYSVRYEVYPSEFADYPPAYIRHVHRDGMPNFDKFSRTINPGDIYIANPGGLYAAPSDYVAEHKWVEFLIHSFAKRVTERGYPKARCFSVDSVLFADGNYTGPDRGHILKAYEALQAAERDEASAVLKSAEASEATGAMRCTLETDARDKADLSPTESVDAYYRSEYLNDRSQEALRLLTLLNRSGLDTVVERARQISKTPPLKITYQAQIEP